MIDIIAITTNANVKVSINASNTVMASPLSGVQPNKHRPTVYSLIINYNVESKH